MYKNVKRLIDFFLGLIILALIWPIIIIVYIILKIDLGGKIIFKQERLGLNMKPFIIYKFKSMKDDTTLSHNERITKVSFWLRRSGLDELPNIFNIIKGDMSFVGPRALMAHDDTMPKEFLNLPHLLSQSPDLSETYSISVSCRRYEEFFLAVLLLPAYHSGQASSYRSFFGETDGI